MLVPWCFCTVEESGVRAIGETSGAAARRVTGREGTTTSRSSSSSWRGRILMIHIFKGCWVCRTFIWIGLG